MSKRSTQVQEMMYCGIDVSAKSLAVAIQRVHQLVEQRSFPNDSIGHSSLVIWLGKSKSPVRVSMEATGIYSLDLAFALDAAQGIEVAVLNPKVANRFAQTIRRSKTDAADAEVLAEYTRRMPFTAWVAPSATSMRLRSIVRHVETLSAQSAQNQNRLHAAHGSTSTPRCVVQDLKRSVASGVGILHGLNTLLVHQGRSEKWRVLFSEVWEDFIGPDLKPLPGCELWWSFVMDHRLRIALDDQDVETGEPIALIVKAHDEKQTAKIPRKPGSRYSEAQRRSLNDLAIATGRLADVLRQKEDARCVVLNEEAIAIYELIGQRSSIAIRELNLGHCYKNVPSIRDLEAAEKHYRLAIDSYPENDTLARSQALAQISMTWLDAIREHGENKPLPPELQQKLNETIQQYEDVLEGLPADARGDLANLHTNLANALRLDPNRRSEAVDHMRLAHRYAVAVGRYDEAAVFRANLAQLFAMSNRPEEASATAEQALHELQDLGMDDADSIPALMRIMQRGS